MVNVLSKFNVLKVDGFWYKYEDSMGTWKLKPVTVFLDVTDCRYHNYFGILYFPVRYTNCTTDHKTFKEQGTVFDIAMMYPVQRINAES